MTLPPDVARRIERDGRIAASRIGGTTPRVYELVWFERPMPMNEYRKLSPFERARYDKVWRSQFGWLAKQQRIPRLDRIIVTVVQTCRHASMPDPGNNYPTAKAAIDGLVDAGVVANDTGECIAAITLVAPEKAEHDRFMLLVEEAE